MKQIILIIALTLATVVANAAVGDLVCSRQMGHAVTTIVINQSSGQFRLIDKWHGAFPTEYTSTGKAEGWLTNSDGHLNAKFSFTAYDVPSKLTVIESEGILLIGDDSPMRNFECAVQ